MKSEVLQIESVELVKDRFGRESWKISALDGSYVLFRVRAGWTKKLAVYAFKHGLCY